MADYGKVNFRVPRSKDLEHDPDYEKIYVKHRSEELELLKQDAKEATIQKIKDVVSHCFAQEIVQKEAELATIQKVLSEAKSLMDNLRACIVTKYYYQDYFNGNKDCDTQDWIHPVAKQYTGMITSYADAVHILADHDYPKLEPEPLENKSHFFPVLQEKKQDTIFLGTTVRKNIKLMVGNISKYILNEERNSIQDQATHKWMIYVRPQEILPEDADLISRIVVFLHPSYKPNDLVEVNKPPFCVCRRGWGEFPVRVQIHFHNSRNKPIDVIHQLKLDKTFTGLQTLGGETLVEVPLYTSREEKATPQTTKSLEDSFSIHSSQPLHQPKRCSFKDSTVEPEGGSNTSLYNFKKLNKTIDNTCLEHQSSGISSSTACEISSSKLVISNSGSLLGSMDSSEENVGRTENCYTNDSVKEEFCTTTLTKTQSSDSGFMCTFENSSSIVPINNENTKVKSEVKDETFLRIASALPIKITVRNKSNSERVHYINPDINGVCLVPISLLKPQSEPEKISSSPLISWNSKYVQFQKKLDQFISNLQIEEYSSIHEIMLHLIKLYPLYSKDPDFPYCAVSEDQFHSWTIGKKLTAEWQRSRQVQKALDLILNLKQMSESLWRVKDIFKWARKFGYSPRKGSLEDNPEDKSPERTTLEDNQEEKSADRIIGFRLTSSEDLLKSLGSYQLNSEKKSKVPPENHVELEDIVDVECVEKGNRGDTLESQHYDSLTVLNRDEKSLVHEVLLQVCRDIISDILHQSLGESSNRTKSSRPTSITCIDVYNGMQNLTVCDFLTNKNMGIQQL